MESFEVNKQLQFDKSYLRMAYEWAKNSYAKRRQVGCLIVKDRMIISDGYNGSPSGFPNVCEGEDGKTLPWTLHSEANAITKLARSNSSSNGATLYVTCQPCYDCAKLIIQAGIKRVVYSEDYHTTEGVELLKKAGIEVTQIKKDSLNSDTPDETIFDPEDLIPFDYKQYAESNLYRAVTKSGRIVRFISDPKELFLGAVGILVQFEDEKLFVDHDYKITGMPVFSPDDQLYLVEREKFKKYFPKNNP